jgi:predicted transcriptional regulator
VTTKKAYAVRLEGPDREIFEEICSKKDITSQRAIEEALKEYIYREQRYLKGKEECLTALQEYLETGDVIDEDEMDRFIADKLKSAGVEL